MMQHNPVFDQPKDSSVSNSGPPRRQRLFFIDNLRTASIILVIMLHAAISVIGFYSQGVLGSNSGNLVENLALIWFTSIAQVLTMAILFFAAGYFTPPSYDSKGTKRYLLERLFRLGVPMIAFDFIVYPITSYLRALLVSGAPASLSDFVSHYFSFSEGLGAGPIWFITHLLIFSILYIVYRLLTKTQNPNRTPSIAPGSQKIFLLVLVLWIVTFMTRLFFPINWPNFWNIKVGYLTLYLPIFFIATLAFQNNWLMLWPARLGRRWLIIGVLAALAFPVFIFLGAGDRIQGGLRWAALAYTLWEVLIAVSLGLGFTIDFREHFNNQNGLTNLAAENSYAVYFIHVPVILAMNFLAWNWDLSMFARFLWLIFTSIPISFLISHLVLRYIPILGPALFNTKRSGSAKL